MLNPEPPAFGRQIPFTLQKMSVEDLPEVMALEQLAYTTPWPEESYRQELLHGTRSYFDVIRYQGKLIGYSGMWHFVTEVHLGTIVTHPAIRKMGVGEFLLINVINRTLKLAATVVTLEVRPSNIAARTLYTKYGFEEVGYRKNYYRDHEDALIMTTVAVDSEAYQAQFKPLAEQLFCRLANFSPDIAILSSM